MSDPAQSNSKSSSKLVLDGLAWSSNIAVSVTIIFVNKVLMSQAGYGFFYATSLCALHFAACTVSLWTVRSLSTDSNATLPLADKVVFTAIADASIVSLNLSLMLNDVGFYQITKLMIVPFICLVECVWLKKALSFGIVTSIALVMGGVAIVTVQKKQLGSNVAGLVTAAISVLASGMQQILCRELQKKHGLSSNELLQQTAPAQGGTLLILGPLLDRYISGSWITSYQWTLPGALALLASCSCAVLVNLSQFACLGRFSALTYQVLGHCKTLLVLIGGWAFLSEAISQKQLFGMAMAVAGMVCYGVATSRTRKSVPLETENSKGGEDPLTRKLLPEKINAEGSSSKA